LVPAIVDEKTASVSLLRRDEDSEVPPIPGRIHREDLLT
jgi:hypothetical protein